METTFLEIFTLLFLFFQTYGASSSNTMITASSNVTCIQKERQSLLVFKQGLTDESNWLSSWTGVECCEWQGVGCDKRNGHVVKLDLRSPSYFKDYDNLNGRNRLEGKVSPSLLNLKHLCYLDLSMNNFSGQNIPEFFGSFKYLEYLYLFDNQLSGNIPQSIGLLTRLQVLDLHSNQLSGNIPTILGQLSNLQDLYLSDNQLSGNIPTSLGQLSNLQCLSLNNNQLDGNIPTSLGQLSNLQYLYLFSNQLSESIPESIALLTSLRELDLSANQLSGSIPESIALLTSLQELDFSANQLSGSIPIGLGQLSNLQYLSLDYNGLSGVVSESHFTKLNNLTGLYLSDNSLTLNVSPHWIPPFQLMYFYASSFNGPQFLSLIQKSTDLNVLHLSNSSIRDIPKWFENISSHILDLDLSHNQIGPQFPDWLKTSTNLQELDLSYSGIVDTIPDWFENITSHIMDLDMSNNQIGGNLPRIRNPGTEIVNLGKNRLSGSILADLCKLLDIRILDLSHNNLSGVLPKCLGNLIQLNVIDLTNNTITGDVPNSMGSLSDLQSLHLQSNKFQGNLPMALQNLTSLVTFDLGNNFFIGNIPAWIGKKLSKLRILNLQSNMFMGKIPLELCQNHALQHLNLANNSITGMIPRCFDNLIGMNVTNIDFEYNITRYEENIVTYIKGMQLKYTKTLQFLISLDLSSNKIIGEIPEALMNLVALNNLNLSRNLLSGQIPTTIGSLKQMESLDLSTNKLYGRIPPGLATLNFLSYLNLSFNNLSGQIPFGDQIQTLGDPFLIYEGNNELCGPTPFKSCNGESLSNTHASKEQNKDDIEDLWLYIGIGIGFVVGFIGLIGSLYFIQEWRVSYFEIIDNVFTWLTVSILVKLARIQRKFFS